MGVVLKWTEEQSRPVIAGSVTTEPDFLQESRRARLSKAMRYLRIKKIKPYSTKRFETGARYHIIQNALYWFICRFIYSSPFRPGITLSAGRSANIPLSQYP